MTWEETIRMIRSKPEYKELVRLAYFEEELPLNVSRFIDSDEFKETLKFINEYHPKAETILDIGSGNGISAVSFALRGYEVTAVEPDASKTVGAGAIRELKAHYKLDSLKVYESLAEDISFPDASFDIVYIRQAMHHAHELDKFIAEAVRVLKPGGLLLTIRDHVVFSERDKQWFLEEHPLHKYYGGENAFSAREYRQAMRKAGAEIQRELKHYDNVINYFPATQKEIENKRTEFILKYKRSLRKRIGILAEISFVFWLYRKLRNIDPNDALDEAQVPGRMYSYIAIKK